jgi:hypothetical protein
MPVHIVKCLAIGVAIMLLVGGCVRSPAISVVADPASGHPCPEDGGLRVRVNCSGGQPPYSLSFGDGTEVTSSTGNEEHVYHPPYTETRYRITASCEGGLGFTDVSIENRPPVFYDIFSVGGNRAAERELVLLQVKYFTKGCASCSTNQCEPYQVYGGKDPDGDVLYYEWSIRKQGTAQEDSVYALSGNRVNGSAAPGECFVWFPKWREASPPFPFSPLSSAGSPGEGLSSGLRPTELEAAVSPKGNYYSYTIRLTIRDYCGAAETYETTWEILEPFN